MQHATSEEIINDTASECTLTSPNVNLLSSREPVVTPAVERVLGETNDWCDWHTSGGYVVEGTERSRNRWLAPGK